MHFDLSRQKLIDLLLWARSTAQIIVNTDAA
jgi:hypothetical protein